ncbi:MAG TPA: hypothetical protein VIK18_18195 [Pirellulales bacterium]
MHTAPPAAAVARATGEPLREIRRRGFDLLNQSGVADFEPYDGSPNMVDWDELDTRRVALFP